MMKNVETLLRTHKKFKRRYTRRAGGDAEGDQRTHTHTHTEILTHTSTPLASSSCASSYYSWAAALCSLINKEKNTLCTMLNVIKIHNNKKKYLFLLHNAA